MTWRLVEGVSGTVLLICLAGRAAAQAPGEETSALLLGVSINDRDVDASAIVLRRDGRFLADVETVRGWRLLTPEAAVVVISGRRYVALSALPGLTTSLDGARQVLRIQATAEAFEGQVLSAGDARPAARSRVVNAAFASYDVALAHGSDAGTAATAVLTAGASGEWGLFTSTQTFSAGGVGAPAVRLDTVYVRNDASRLHRLSLGDAITAGSAWVQPIRFAGLRYGTAFDLQPGLITFPTPALLGRTTVPTNVELYVNDVLRYQATAASGSFVITQAPLVTGAGRVSLQVQDALGVEHAVSSSYYVSPSLLRPGLNDFSVEAGAERRSYGLRSFDYGPAFAAASLRRGITEWATLETRAELGARVQDLGIGADLRLSTLGEMRLAAAASSSRSGRGVLVQAGFSRITPRWSVSAFYQHATPAFRQVGTDSAFNDVQVRQQAQVAGGFSLGRFGGMTASYSQLKLGDQPRTRIASITYTVSLAGRAFLNLFALHSGAAGGRRETQAGFAVTVPFGRRSSLYAEAQGAGFSAEVRTAPPTDEGLGGRAAIRQGPRDAQEAELTYRSQAGEATLQAAHSGGGADVRLLVSGAALFVGGRIAPSRQLEGGFALVETPGVRDVQVFAENRPAARTDRNGLAVITNLRPYEENKISVNAADLPIEAGLVSNTLVVSPGLLAGARARFDVVMQHPATVVLRDASGRPLEAGLPVRINGGETLHTGYDGELFAPSLRRGDLIEVDRGGPAACRAVTPALPPGGGIPRLDPVTCRASASP